MNLGVALCHPLSPSAVKYPWAVVVVVTALAIPCGLAAMRMQKSLSTLSFTPRGSVGTEGYKEISAHFVAGFLFSYYLITTPTSLTAVGDMETMFNATNDLVAANPVNMVSAVAG